jgi:hypothetical protein
MGAYGMITKSIQVNKKNIHFPGGTHDGGYFPVNSVRSLYRVRQKNPAKDERTLIITSVVAVILTGIRMMVPSDNGFSSRSPRRYQLFIENRTGDHE